MASSEPVELTEHYERFGVCVNAERRIGVFLAPTSSMLAFVAAVEPLRVANWRSGRALHHWSVVGIDGAAAPTAIRRCMPGCAGRPGPLGRLLTGLWETLR